MTYVNDHEINFGTKPFLDLRVKRIYGVRTSLDYSMEYFWTTFGPLLEYPSESCFDDCSLVFSMEYFRTTFVLLLEYPSKSRFDDCSLVFITLSACCEPCTNNKKLHAEPSLPITNYCIVQLLVI